MQVYTVLFEAYGPQNWWPAETAFEVVVGAVLTQNTSWKNVEKAINNLKGQGDLSLESICGLPDDKLAELVYPSGYYNIKTKRLKNLCHWISRQGGMEVLAERSTTLLRTELLSVNGIGPETADDILLYAFERPVFVIDAYTRRLFSTLKLLGGDEPYEMLRRGFEHYLDSSTQLFNEYHALIVRHAKEKCRSTPGCLHCRVESVPAADMPA